MTEAMKLCKIEDDPEDIEAEVHSVPFGALPIVAFADLGLRRTVAEYWRPDLHDDEDEMSVLGRLLAGVAMRGEAEALSLEHQRAWSDVRVKIRVVLDYPLEHTWCVDAEIPANEIGQIFSIAHDMYTTLYELDDESHGGPAPRIAPGMLNRAKGSHVWGHDMTDLVFEAVLFTADPEAIPLDRKASYTQAVPLGTFRFGIGS